MSEQKLEEKPEIAGGSDLAGRESETAGCGKLAEQAGCEKEEKTELSGSDAEEDDLGGEKQEKSLTEAQEKGVLEAILFSMGESVELNRLAAVIRESPAVTRRILRSMMEDYRGQERGIQLLELGGAYQLCTKKDYYLQLTEIAKQPKKPVLTDVVMETLSIIAYKQPVTKAEIEKIRGVSSEHAVNKLLEYDLVQELGRLNVPGRPILLGTTETFLRFFGVESTEALPRLDPVQLEDFKAEAEAEMNIRMEV